MATIKVKFRPSSVDTKEGTLYYQVIHGRITRQIKVGYKLLPEEWNRHTSEILLPRYDHGWRETYLLTLKQRIAEDRRRLERLVADLDKKGMPYTADDVVFLYFTRPREKTFFSFMREVIATLKQQGKIRTSETYTATLNSFMRFRRDFDLSFDEMDSEQMLSYEAYLKKAGVGMNTSSFYARNLRAVYNRGVEKGLTCQRYPFRHVYTGVEKTVKRALSFESIRRIKHLDLSCFPQEEQARDLFLFSLYTRGMSFVDMSYLKKTELKAGVLSYRRRKTGQKLYIRWEKCMEEIVKKYNRKDSPYLLPVICQPGADERRQYKNALSRVNRQLKKIGKQLKLPVPLTLYVARHSWASIARSRNVPLSVISEAMGHDSEATTRIYLASLDTELVDKANKTVLRGL